MQGKILVDQVGSDTGIATVDKGRSSTTDEMIAGDVYNISKENKINFLGTLFFPHSKLLLNTGCVDETLVS